MTHSYKSNSVTAVLYPCVKSFILPFNPELADIPDTYAHMFASEELDPAFLIQNVFLPQWERIAEAATEDVEDLPHSELFYLLDKRNQNKRIATDGNAFRFLLKYGRSFEAYSRKSVAELSQNLFKINGILKSRDELRNSMHTLIPSLTELYKAAMPADDTSWSLVDDYANREYSASRERRGVSIFISNLVDGLFLTDADIADCPRLLSTYKDKLELHFKLLLELERLLKNKQTSCVAA